MKYRAQLDESDCGAACLAMISSFFGKKLSIADIRNDAGTDISGTNINGLLIAAKKYGLKATAVKGSEKSISSKLEVPFIAHMHLLRTGNRWIDHYVIVKDIGKRKIKIWDPDPLYKAVTYSYEEFINFWTGYAIFLEPDIDFTKTEKKQTLLWKFIILFLPYKKILFYALLCSLLLLCFGIFSSFYYKIIFDEVIYSNSSLTLNTLSFGMFIVVITQSILYCIRSSLLLHFSFKTDIQLNFSYLSHIFDLPISFFESRKSGEILSRLGDLNKISQTLSSSALSGVMDILMLLVSGPILFSINVKLFGISACSVLIVALISMFFSKIYRRYYPKLMSQNGDVQSYLHESLRGVSTIKALNAETIVNKKYESKHMASVDTNWILNKYNNVQNLISTIINGIGGVLIYWFGCSSILGDALSFGTLITFNSLLGYFTGPLFRLVNIQNLVNEAFVAAERVGEILELEKEKDESRKYITPLNIRGKLKFEHVTFAYGNHKPIYEDLSFEISENCWTAFVGPSGCGKTTLIKMILKFYEQKEGAIYLDGIDLRYIDTSYLRSKIGYVPQDVFLFSGTVAENISFHCPEAKMDEIIMAAKKAGADEFIKKLPKQYETILGENGCGLSGGEKQRLALARALLGNPSLIILDEATSNLDVISEMEIHRTINSLRADQIAVIVIAHRLTTVKNCDKIFVMSDGKIIQQGTHQELIVTDGMYKSMWFGE